LKRLNGLQINVFSQSIWAFLNAFVSFIQLFSRDDVPVWKCFYWFRYLGCNSTRRYNLDSIQYILNKQITSNPDVNILNVFLLSNTSVKLPVSEINKKFFVLCSEWYPSKSCKFSKQIYLKFVKIYDLIQ
jgi:hypothetical protein